MTSSGTEENFINTSRYIIRLGEFMVNISGWTWHFVGEHHVATYTFAATVETKL